MLLRLMVGLALSLLVGVALAQEKTGDKPEGTQGSAKQTTTAVADLETLATTKPATATHPAHAAIDYFGLVFVFILATFIGLGVVARVSRLLHTPLMSLTNAISAIAVVGAIIITGSDYPLPIRLLGVVALVASMTNAVSGFLITDRMLKMFKQTRSKGKT